MFDDKARAESTASHPKGVNPFAMMALGEICIDSRQSARRAQSPDTQLLKVAAMRSRQRT